MYLTPCTFANQFKLSERVFLGFVKIKNKQAGTSRRVIIHHALFAHTIPVIVKNP